MEFRAARTCLVFASAILLLSGSGCGSSNSGPPTAAELGQKYTLSSTDIPGWQVDANDPPKVLQEGTANDLESVMDGGSSTFTGAPGGGCTMSVYEKLLGTSPQTATFYAMYFGTDASATAIFNSQVQTNTATDSISGFDPSVAAGYGALISHTVFAHFGAMFFRLVVSGITDATSAYQVAAQFLTVFKTETN